MTRFAQFAFVCVRTGEPSARICMYDCMYTGRRSCLLGEVGAGKGVSVLMTVWVWGGYYVATGLCVPRVVFAPRNRSEGRPERIAVRSRPRGRAPSFAQRKRSET